MRTRPVLAAVMALPVIVAGCGGPPPSAASARATAYAVQSSANALAPELSDGETARLRVLAENPDTDDVVAHVVAGPDDVTTVDLEPRRRNGEIERSGARIPVLVGERLDALQLAIRDASARGRDDRPLDRLAAAGGIGARTVVALGSGVGTGDPLDRNVLGWDVDPEALAADLDARRLLPDLPGRDVVLSGLGRTAGRQPRLGLPEQAALRDDWMAICRGTGARCRVDDTPRPATPPTSGVDTGVVAPLASPTTGQGGRELSVPAPVLFRPGRCELVDPAAAARVLAPLAERLRQGGRVSISGRTAPVGPGDGVELGACRARTCADVLRASGVPDSAIAEVRGDGSRLDPASAGRDAAGRLDPDRLAALRRVVFVVDEGEKS